jgi:DNA polymerase zeta
MLQFHDPEILVGYEVQMSSWGYLIERAAKLGFNLAPKLSRMPGKERDSKMNEEEDKYA